MSARGFIKKNQPLIAVVCVCVVGFAIWRTIFVGTGYNFKGPDGFWIYDLTSGEVSVRGPLEFPPLALESGGAGVRAEMFSCSSCSDESTHQIAVLFKYSDPMKAVLERGEYTDDDMSILTSDRSELVASLEMAKNNEWQPLVRARDKLLSEAVSVCGGTHSMCRP